MSDPSQPALGLSIQTARKAADNLGVNPWPSEASGGPDWSQLVEQSPIPTLIFDDPVDDEGERGGRVRFANASARSLFATDDAGDVADGSIWGILGPACHGPLRRLLARAVSETLEPAGEVAGGSGAQQVGVVALTGAGPETLTLHLQQLAAGGFFGQFTRCEGWRAVDRVVAEQQRFRSALMELSELAHSTEDDDDFYQRLIERAVEVVPGAQGGSVQLNIPGTATFRFVAALGYDLAGLQRQVLEPEDFFRDAWNPDARIVTDFGAASRSPEIAEWLETVGRLSEIVVNVSAPVLSGGYPVAFLSLDNFEDPTAMTDTTVEMTTVLGRLIGELWQRRELEAEVRKEREAYRRLAMHDPLTGLANRRNLERSLQTMMATTERQGRPSAVLFVDIDDFKGVNDRLGHEMGDSLLTSVAEGLRQAVRAGDVVGRWGGDEFLILPQRIASSAEAAALAVRVLEHFETELDLGNGCSHRARLSVGIGWTEDSQVDSDRLVRAADEALYEAKAAGKGVARLREA